MSDILSRYFEKISKPKYKRQNSTLSGNLSEYGLTLLTNNILSFSPNKLKKYSKLQTPICLSEKSNKHCNLKKLTNNDNNIFVQINEDNSIEENIKKKKVKLKKRNNLILNNKNNLNDKLMNNNFKEKIDSIIQNKDKKSSLNISGIKNKKNTLSIEKDEEKINLIIEDLMKKKIKRRNFEKKKTFSFSDLNQRSSKIDPMKYINLNISEHPHNLSKFKSRKIQIKILGNLKYRNFLLEGINYYKDKCIKYNNIKGFSHENEEKKTINKKIKEMFEDNKKFKIKLGLIKKKKKLKNNYAFSFDNKENKKIETINNLNLRLNSISKNNIEKLSNYIKKNKKFFSFDKKINLILLRTNKTCNFIKKRTEEYDQINKVIFNFIM